MSSGLPVQIQLQKAIASAIRLQGSLDLFRMPRLKASLLDAQGTVEVRLEIERSEDGAPRLRGCLKTALQLECQRCLGEMTLPLDIELNLRLTGQPAGEDSPDDSLEISDDVLRVHELIEDELILALPVVAMHAHEDDCEQGQWRRESPVQGESDRPNPFAALADLKTR